MFNRSFRLSNFQKRNLSSSLVAMTALVSIVTVAAPTLFPCPMAGVAKGSIATDANEEQEFSIELTQGAAGTDIMKSKQSKNLPVRVSS
jgi:hypothetical protein